MEYTIQQLARLAGVTTRTLRHYHQIGLLPPARVTGAGYRIYTSREANLLQQILFYRELDMPLAEIQRLVCSPGFRPENTLQNHLVELEKKRDRLDALIQTARQTLAHMRGEIDMKDSEKFAGFKKQLVDENEEKYGEETRRKYGDEAVDASNAKMLNMTEEQYNAFTALSQELNETLTQAALAGDPAAPLAQKAANLHRQWLQSTWKSYAPDAHMGLVQMYVDDPRFTEYYEKIVPGGAVFLRDAVAIFLGE